MKEPQFTIRFADGTFDGVNGTTVQNPLASFGWNKEQAEAQLIMHSNYESCEIVQLPDEYNFAAACVLRNAIPFYEKRLTRLALLCALNKHGETKDYHKPGFPLMYNGYTTI